MEMQSGMTDPAARCESRTLGEHVAALGLAAEKGCFSVEAKSGIPVILAAFLCCMVAIHPRIVDCYMQPTQICHYLFNHPARWTISSKLVNSYKTHRNPSRVLPADALRSQECAEAGRIDYNVDSVTFGTSLSDAIQPGRLLTAKKTVHV